MVTNRILDKDGMDLEKDDESMPDYGMDREKAGVGRVTRTRRDQGSVLGMRREASEFMERNREKIRCESKVETKRCESCIDELPLYCFPIHRNVCYDCIRIAERDRRAIQRKRFRKIRNADTHSVACSKCHVEWPARYYQTQGPVCPACREITRERREMEQAVRKEKSLARGMDFFLLKKKAISSRESGGNDVEMEYIRKILDYMEHLNDGSGKNHGDEKNGWSRKKGLNDEEGETFPSYHDYRKDKLSAEKLEKLNERRKAKTGHVPS